MASNGPDPREFLEQAQRMLRELFGEPRGEEEPWAAATRQHQPSAEERRENQAFALATRAVEALEDVALNLAAIRQRLERGAEEPATGRPQAEQRTRDADD